MRALRGAAFDLENYEFVRENAPLLLASVQEDTTQPGMSRLRGVPLMPINEAAWSAERIAVFEQWIRDGCPRGTAAVVIPRMPASLPVFLAMSGEATGFELEGHPTGQSFLNRWSAHVSDEIATSALELYNSEGFGTVHARFLDQVRSLILLWYTGAIFSGTGVPIDVGDAGDGTYRAALVWRAIRAHPVGYATEGGYRAAGDYDAPGATYWERPPEVDGTGTGLGGSGNGA